MSILLTRQSAHVVVLCVESTINARFLGIVSRVSVIAILLVHNVLLELGTVFLSLLYQDLLLE